MHFFTVVVCLWYFARGGIKRKMQKSIRRLMRRFAIADWRFSTGGKTLASGHKPFVGNEKREKPVTQSGKIERKKSGRLMRVGKGHRDSNNKRKVLAPENTSYYGGQPNCQRMIRSGAMSGKSNNCCT
jgi:hypothetical protein